MGKRVRKSPADFATRKIREKDCSNNHRIKTVRKEYRPFTLEDCYILHDDLSYDPYFAIDVVDELLAMHEAMKKCEEEFFKADLDNLIQTLNENDDKLSGSKNAAMRPYIDKLPESCSIPDPKHTYNFLEMLRYNIGSKAGIYVTRYRLEVLFECYPGLEPRDYRKHFIEDYGFEDVPSVTAIKKHLAAYKKSGEIQSSPSSAGLLPFSATDGHYRQFGDNDLFIWLILPLNCGKAVLVFRKPRRRKRRFVEGKVCVPTMRVTASGRILFDFVLAKRRPKMKDDSELSGIIGVDCGVVNTVVYGFLSNDLTYSQPFVESGRIQRLEKRIDLLYDEIEALRAKAFMCEQNGFFDKADVLYAEAARKRHKVSKLKELKSKLAASEIVAAAFELNAGIAVEDLAWKPESSWDEAFLQEVLADLAADVGIPVIKVPCAGTSMFCEHCSAQVRESGRDLICDVCDHRVGRDIRGYRNVGLRGLGYDHGDLEFFSYSPVRLGSLSSRRERVRRARGINGVGDCNQLPCKVPGIDTLAKSTVIIGSCLVQIRA